MAKYSRVEKYKNLRNNIQNDTEDDIYAKNKDLVQYRRRLSQINAQNFEEPGDTDPSAFDPVSSRRRQMQEQMEQPVCSSQPADPYLNMRSSHPAAFSNNENYTNILNNEYLNDYIKEVKQYNVDRGNAASGNTDLDILRSIRGADQPLRPYPDEPAAPAPVSRKEYAPASSRYDKTMDIPFFSSGSGNSDSDFEEEPQINATQTMSREDIAAEVKKLISDQGRSADADAKAKSYSGYIDTHLEEDRTARQRLLNETTQMRAQLDDYEDNLTEVSDKMRRTNHILNVVLMVLILVLIGFLCVVIYWIWSSKGSL